MVMGSRFLALELEKPCVILLHHQNQFYPEKSLEIFAVHLCYDNFDLDEETPSGFGTTHSTYGIVIQELRDPEKTTVVAEADTSQIKKTDL